MNSTTPLTKELIADTTLWRLILRISPKKLCALLIGPESVERSVIFHAEELGDTSSKALENAVYDNPLLLGDFAAIDVVFSTAELVVNPRLSEMVRDDIVAAMLPDFGEARRFESALFPGGEIDFAVPAELFNFVTRTFAAARIHHSLAIDATYLSHRNMESAMAAKSYVLCEGEGEMVLLTFDAHGAISHINRPQPSGATDCAYYTLLGADADTPIMVGGEPELRNGVCDILRKMRPDARVLPLTLDEDLLHLRRMAPSANFDMLFLTKL